MSERELLHTDWVLVVEGKYDAARLSHLTDALILLTDGFGIYKDKKRGKSSCGGSCSHCGSHSMCENPKAFFDQIKKEQFSK